MKTTIETLYFPCEIMNKLKMKVSTTNLNIEYLNGHIIKFDKNNLGLEESFKIIVKNSKYSLVAPYSNNDKIYLPIENAIISFTKFVNILNYINKF